MTGGRITSGAIVLVLASIVTTACSGDDDDSDAGRPSSTPASTIAVPPGAPAEVAEFRDDWPTANHDYDNSRTASASSIDGDNVDDLEVGWRAEIDSIGGLSTTPLVLGDTVYLQGSSGRVAALDRATGDVRWTTEGGFNIGPFGVAVGDGRVYALHGSSGVKALDAKTGKAIWERDVIATKTTGIDIQPVVYDGTVFVSTVPVSVGGIYEGGDRGVIYAVDAATGDTKWEFDTVDSPDVWGNPEVNSGGGAWYPPAIDAARGVAYFGVANPAPFPGVPEFPNGTSRPGPNLYTDSLVALDLETGKLDWYHQVTEHDIFDRDQVHALIARLDDGTDMVISAGKSAVVVGLDPETGKPKWRTEIGVHDNDDLEALDGPTVLTPGTYGGVLTPPATADGVVYLPVINAPAELKPDETAYFGAEMGQQDGEVVAVDAADGKVLWSTKVPGDPLGGTTVVNDLVLTTLLEGTLVALDRESGEIVAQQEADGGTNGWMSVADDMIIVPLGNAQPPALVAYRLRD